MSGSGLPLLPALAQNAFTYPRAGNRMAQFRAGMSGSSWAGPNNSFKPKTNRYAIVFGLIQALEPMTSTHDDLDFISSICSNFADALNKNAGECLFSGQDAYEALTAAFGGEFSEKDLRAATRQDHQALAKALVVELEFELATPDIAKSALEYALGSWA